MKTVLGIDEAGRGPVIGSMFIGGFSIPKEKLEKLSKIGLKDSKKLTDKKRESLRKEIENYGETHLKEFSANQIDELREVMSLNVIELKGFAKMIDEIKPDVVYIDLPEPNAERFINKIKNNMETQKKDRIEFIAEHEADDTYPVVSAASVVAKSARERHVKKLHKKYGYDFRSGYPHDKPTIEFLETYVREKGELPPETRESWSTATRILKENTQKSIGDF